MKQQSGFSLIELMVTIAIAAILTAIAVPNFLTWRASRQLNSSAREILSAIRDTRMQAIREQAQTVIVFDAATGTYEAFIDDGEGSLDEDLDGRLDNAETDFREEGETIIASGTLPESYRFSSITLNNSKAVFNMRGMLDGINGSVTLASSNGDSRRIILLVTGNARIE